MEKLIRVNVQRKIGDRLIWKISERGGVKVR